MGFLSLAAVLGLGRYLVEEKLLGEEGGGLIGVGAVVGLKAMHPG